MNEFGVTDIKNLIVLWWLYSDHVALCNSRSFGVSMKTSDQLIIDTSFVNGLNCEGKVVRICSTSGMYMIDSRHIDKTVIQHAKIRDAVALLTLKRSPKS